MAAVEMRGETSLAARLRELREERATGAVRVRYAKGSGAVYLSEGQVVHAEHGRVQGEFGYWQLLGLPEVELEFEADAAPVQRSIQRDIEAGEPPPALDPLASAPLEPRPLEPPVPEPRPLPPARPAALSPRPPAPREERRRAAARSFELVKGRSPAASAAPAVAEPAAVHARSLEPRIALQPLPRRRPAGPALVGAVLLGGGLGAALWFTQSGAQAVPAALGRQLERALSSVSGTPQPRAGAVAAARPGAESSARPAAPLAASAAAAPVAAAPAAVQPPAADGAPAQALEASELRAPGDRVPVPLRALQLAAPQPDPALLPSIVLRLRVDEEGQVAEARVYQPRAELAEYERTALDAVRELRFEPALHDWRAVPVWLNYSVSFENPAGGRGARQ